jgi:hypothetical protein
VGRPDQGCAYTAATRKNRRIIVKVDIEVANKAIYWRGLFITRYAAVEFAIAELVSRAFSHQAYEHLGHPPFGPVKKFKRLNQLIGLPGPIANYRSELQVRLDDFAIYGDHRGFLAHALMVSRSIASILLFTSSSCGFDRNLKFITAPRRPGVTL